MRVNRQKAAENRERIVDTAAPLFRESRFTRVRTQLEPPHHSGGSKNDACQEVSRQFVVTGGDAAKVLESAKHAAGSAYARPRMRRRSAPLGRPDLTQFAVRG